MSGCAHEPLGIRRLHAAAIEYKTARGHIAASRLLKQPANKGVHRLGLLRGGGETGTDGPDRFIGDGSPGEALDSASIDDRVHLPAPRSVSVSPGFPLGRGFPRRTGSA